MAERTCSVDRCDKPAHARGWCPTHYERWRRHGDVTVVKPKGVWKRPPPGVCSIDGCDRPVRSRGWCNAHYQRWYFRGDPLTVLSTRKPIPQPSYQPATTCSVDGCTRKIKGRGLCNMHYQRWRNAQDDNVTPTRNRGWFSLGQKPTNVRRGHRNNTGRTHFAKGQKPWNAGTAPVYTCEVCGKEFVKHGRTRKRRFCSHECQGVALSGEHHWAWRGGTSSLNSRLRRTARYRRWRRAVFERDDFTCQLCGARGVKLHADHIKPFALYPDLRFELSNGRVLCVPCHRATPTWGSGSWSV